MNRVPLLHYVELTVLSSLIVPSASGQQQEVGILAGATTPSAQITVGSFGSFSGGVSATVQVSYAFRVVGAETSSLYVELPVSRVAKASVSVDERGAGVSVSQVFFTPGVRFKILPSKRVSPYLTAGAGFGWFDSADVKIDPDLRVNVSSGFKPVVTFGGGLEFRLTRFMNFRTEMCDYVAAGSFVGNRNHLAYAGGFGFVF